MFVAVLMYGGGAMVFGFDEGRAVWSKVSRRFRR